MAKMDKKIVGVIAGVVVVAAVATVAVVMINKNNSGSSNEGGSTSSLVEDLKKVDARISYDDFEGMKNLSKDIQNGKMTGKVVEIDGLVNHPGQSYSIVEKSADGKQKIGTVFTIEDGEKADYPSDGARITITAKVVEKESLNFQLVTLKEYIKK